jgi:hypothetical protein
MVTAMEPDRAARSFDWRLYSDATAAGLSALIPIPFVDLVFESVFRRRMPSAIARVRQRELDSWDSRRLAQGQGTMLSLAGCLAIPAFLVRYILKKVWRKIIYIFAVTDAANQLSVYWHRAYLLDHMMRAGHLNHEADSNHAIEAFRKTLREADTRPLIGIAREVIAGSHRVFRLLVRARRHGSTEATQTLSKIVADHWGAAERSLREVAELYNDVYTSHL